MIRLTAALFAVFTLLTLQSVSAKNYCDEMLCIETIESDRSVRFKARSKVDGTLSLRLTLELENARTEGGAVQIFKLEPNEERDLTVARATPGSATWYYSFRYWYRVGDVAARHDDGVRYALPFASGKGYPIIQGCNGAFSHNGPRRYATDFAMPEGTPIHASRGGKVVSVKADSRVGGASRKYYDDSNFILIEHADGTIGSYHHLIHRGVEVSAGDMVEAGQRIGRSGNTGWSTGPHLHFEVWKPNRSMDILSLKITYDTAEGEVTCPASRSIRRR